MLVRKNIFKMASSGQEDEQENKIKAGKMQDITPVRKRSKEIFSRRKKAITQEA